MAPRFVRLLMLPALCGSLAAAASSDQQIRFTTYLRQGPDRSYRVIDEAQTGQRVTVESCAHAWCRVRLGGADGYVAQAALASPRAIAPTQRCAIASQSGHHGAEPVQICSGR